MKIVDRDQRDMEREIAPLKQADDAVLLDTSNINREESIAAIVNMIKASMHEGSAE